MIKFGSSCTCITLIAQGGAKIENLWALSFE